MIEISEGGEVPLEKILEQETLTFERLQEINSGEATFSQFIAKSIRAHFFHRGSGGYFF